MKIIDEVIEPFDAGDHRAEVLLGVPVDAVSGSEAISTILAWGQARSSRYVVFANAHVVVTATQDVEFANTVRLADLTLPDGAPVAWMLRRLGYPHQERVCGPDLTWDLLARCAESGQAVYFYGSTDETLGRLMHQITTAFPELHIAGSESPPFRLLSQEETDASVSRINASGAALVFVGLGCPKQEHWMRQQCGEIKAVMLGVGAAFDFHAGTVSRAPRWMRRHGLEWLHRLITEPRRLWRRYLITNTLFVWGACRRLLMQRSLRS
jgi:N-acetylglucosaminyldiphosphoundecaprenol N-acetyl-beta-D-mannosaminyltransferase